MVKADNRYNGSNNDNVQKERKKNYFTCSTVTSLLLYFVKQ